MSIHISVFFFVKKVVVNSYMYEPVSLFDYIGMF